MYIACYASRASRTNSQSRSMTTWRKKLCHPVKTKAIPVLFGYHRPILPSLTTTHTRGHKYIYIYTCADSHMHTGRQLYAGRRCRQAYTQQACKTPGLSIQLCGPTGVSKAAYDLRGLNTGEVSLDHEDSRVLRPVLRVYTCGV